MKRAELRRIVENALPNARVETADALGTPLHHAFLDVTLPSSDLPALNALCASIGRKAPFVSVLSYSGWSHRRIRVNP
jgi:ABC-type arginine transport system permease subunit